MTTTATTTNPGGEPASVEVDLGSEKLSLPKDIAGKVIAWRDAQKQSTREIHERIGKIEADKQAAEAARLKAEEDKQAIEHAKKGEIDQVRELLTKQSREREAKLASHLRDKALRAAVASAPKVVPTAVDDIVDQLRARSRYDFDADAVVVCDEAGAPVKDTSGKPVAVDAFIGEWLTKRPHYVLDSTPPGSGAASGQSRANGKTMTREAWEKWNAESPKAAAQFLTQGGKFV